MLWIYYVAEVWHVLLLISIGLCAEVIGSLCVACCFLVEPFVLKYLCNIDALIWILFEHLQGEIIKGVGLRLGPLLHKSFV